MICFVIHVFEETREEVLRTLSQLRLIYPESEVRVIYDGVRSMELRDFPERECLRMKESRYGGAWTHRYLSHFLETSSASHLIKIDPDTEIVQRARMLPTGEAVFAGLTSVCIGDIMATTPHGGALGFTRAMASQIVKNQWMLDPRFCNSIKYSSAQDIMLRDCVLWNGISLIHRSDFSCGTPPTDSSSFVHA